MCPYHSHIVPLAPICSQAGQLEMLEKHLKTLLAHLPIPESACPQATDAGYLCWSLSGLQKRSSRQKQLKEERIWAFCLVILDFGFSFWLSMRGQNMRVGVPWWPEHEAAAHTVSTVRKQLSPLIKYKTPSHSVHTHTTCLRPIFSPQIMQWRSPTQTLRETCFLGESRYCQVGWTNHHTQEPTSRTYILKDTVSLNSNMAFPPPQVLSDTPVRPVCILHKGWSVCDVEEQEA